MKLNDDILKIRSEGAQSISADGSGKDNYDFRSRAALVRRTKEHLDLGELEPLPSPWTLEIEPTLLCNAACHFCSYAEDIKRFVRLRKSTLKIPHALLLKSITCVLRDIQSAGTTKGTYWSGGGEPTVWPHLVEAIQQASAFTQVFLQTNGILLNRFLGTLETLALLDLVSISVVADNCELHKSIMHSNTFERVVGNIRKAVAMKKEYGLLITINTKILVDRINFTRLPQIVEYYHNLGVDSISIRLVDDFNYGGGGGPRSPSVQLLAPEKLELYEIIQRSPKRHPALIAFSDSLSAKYAKPQITIHCFNVIDGHFACIDAWGDVYIGNPEIGDRTLCIGNITSQPWHEIWKGETHYQVIRLMDTMQREGVCNNSLCRHVKANQGAEDYVNGAVKALDTAVILNSYGSFL